MNCKKCGSLLNENDQFCKECGAPVNAQDEQINVQQPMNSQPDLMQQSMNNQPDLMQQPVNNQSDLMQQSMNNQPDLMQQPVNNQSDLMQQPMNNQPDLIQQPMNNSQPMNNMQQNYSNNNQNSWQNSSSPTPNFQQKKSNGNGKFIGIGVAVAVVILGLIFGMKLFDNNGSNNYGGIANNTNSTYTVKFQGFTFKVPTNLIYDTDIDALYLGDEAGTWEAVIEVISGSFSQLQVNKNQLISVYQQVGYNAANVNQKTYGGLDFITIELTHSGQKAILGFTKANSMYVFGTTIYNLDNDFDYSLLSDVAKVLSSAEYSGETNNISGFNKVDMGPVDDLVK